MRIAYLATFLALIVLGFFLLHVSVWLSALIGILVATPVVVADLVISHRRKTRVDQPD